MSTRNTWVWLGGLVTAIAVIGVSASSIDANATTKPVLGKVTPAKMVHKDVRLEYGRGQVNLSGKLTAEEIHLVIQNLGVPAIVRCEISNQDSFYVNVTEGIWSASAKAYVETGVSLQLPHVSKDKDILFEVFPDPSGNYSYFITPKSPEHVASISLDSCEVKEL